jgi:hypothetical protein
VASRTSIEGGNRSTVAGGLEPRLELRVMLRSDATARNPVRQLRCGPLACTVEVLGTALSKHNSLPSPYRAQTPR